MQHDYTSSMVAALIINSVPNEVLSYGEKILSVALLAMVAEGGRRLVGYLVNKVKGS